MMSAPANRKIYKYPYLKEFTLLQQGNELLVGHPGRGKEDLVNNSKRTHTHMLLFPISNHTPLQNLVGDEPSQIREIAVIFELSHDPAEVVAESHVRKEVPKIIFFLKKKKKKKSSARMQKKKKLGWALRLSPSRNKSTQQKHKTNRHRPFIVLNPSVFGWLHSVFVFVFFFLHISFFHHFYRIRCMLDLVKPVSGDGVTCFQYVISTSGGTVCERGHLLPLGQSAALGQGSMIIPTFY